MGIYLHRDRCAARAMIRATAPARTRRPVVNGRGDEGEL
jgi:hypothetical protein